MVRERTGILDIRLAVDKVVATLGEARGLVYNLHHGVEELNKVQVKELLKRVLSLLDSVTD